MDEMAQRLDAMVRKCFAGLEASVDVRDFRLSLRDGWYTAVFDGALGQKCRWEYAPGVRFSPEKKGWECRIGEVRFLLPACPLHELVFELRPVLLTGDLSDSGLVLDMGPGSGVFSMYAAARARDGRVLAVEPDKEASEFLRTVARVNGIENLQVLQAAYDSPEVLEAIRDLGGALDFIRVGVPDGPEGLPVGLAGKLRDPGGRMAVLCGDLSRGRDMAARMGFAGLDAESVFGYLPTVLAVRGAELPEGLCPAGDSLKRMDEARRKKDFIQEKARVSEETRQRGHGPKAERPDYPDGSVFLLGLPGSGREPLGRELARRLELPFVAESDWAAVRDLVGSQGAVVAVVAPGSVREEEARKWLKGNGRAFYLMNDVWNILRAQGLDPSGEAFEARRAELAELSAELEPLFMKTVHFPLLGSYGMEELVADALEKSRF